MLNSPNTLFPWSTDPLSGTEHLGSGVPKSPGADPYAVNVHQQDYFGPYDFTRLHEPANEYWTSAAVLDHLDPGFSTFSMHERFEIVNEAPEDPAFQSDDQSISPPLPALVDDIVPAWEKDRALIDQWGYYLQPLQPEIEPVSSSNTSTHSGGNGSENDEKNVVTVRKYEGFRDRGRMTAAAAAAQEPTKRQRKKFTPKLREETHLTRKIGACLSCWKNRKRCIRIPGGGGCCRYCESLISKIPNMPCFRARMTESELFRRGPTDEFCWTRRRWLKASSSNNKIWTASPGRKFQVTQGMGLTLNLVAKEYKPLQDDKDTYTWIDENGKYGELTTTHFAIAEIDDAQRAVNRYVEDNMERYIKEYVAPDTILGRTFEMAVKMSASEWTPLLRNALKLWVGSRIIEEPWNIVGAETFGMSRCTSSTSPYYNKIPVTPIMDFQIDNITIHHLLIPMRKKILQELQRKVLENKQKNFLEIYLTLFILLNNVELTVRHDRWFARRYSMKTRFSNYGLIQNVFQGANILLAHFHHVNKGYHPFSLDWDSRDTVRTAKLNDEQVEYMKAVIQAVKYQEGGLRSLKENGRYDESMYWCSQLFFGGWKPEASPVMEQ